MDCVCALADPCDDLQAEEGDDAAAAAEQPAAEDEDLLVDLSLKKKKKKKKVSTDRMQRQTSSSCRPRHCQQSAGVLVFQPLGAWHEQLTHSLRSAVILSLSTHNPVCKTLCKLL